MISKCIKLLLMTFSLSILYSEKLTGFIVTIISFILSYFIFPIAGKTRLSIRSVIGNLKCAKRLMLNLPPCGFIYLFVFILWYTIIICIFVHLVLAILRKRQRRGAFAWLSNMFIIVYLFCRFYVHFEFSKIRVLCGRNGSWNGGMFNNNYIS